MISRGLTHEAPTWITQSPFTLKDALVGTSILCGFISVHEVHVDYVETTWIAHGCFHVELTRPNRLCAIVRNTVDAYVQKCVTNVGSLKVKGDSVPTRGMKNVSLPPRRAALRSM